MNQDIKAYKRFKYNLIDHQLLIIIQKGHLVSNSFNSFLPVVQYIVHSKSHSPLIFISIQSLMPPKRSNPPASKRVLRSQHITTPKPSARIKARVSQTRPRKRKVKDLDPESRSGSDEPEPSEDEVPEMSGTSAIRQTTRERLLDILGKSIRPKRPRLSTQSAPVAASGTSENQPSSSDNALQTIDQHANTTIDYNQFHDNQMINMLKEVGLDTNGFQRNDLLKNCQIYTDLIILPSASRNELGQHPEQTTIKHPQFNFTMALPEKKSHDSNPTNQGIPHSFSLTKTSNLSTVEVSLNTPDAGPSVSILPSLEHKRLLYPRPRPTVLSSTLQPSKKPQDKGKGRARSRSPSHSDWNPEENLGNESNTDNDDLIEADSGLPSPTNNSPQTPLHTHLSEEQTPDETSASPNTKTLDIRTLHILLIQTNKKVESLEDEVKSLSHVVNKLAGSFGENGTSQSKRRGGRTADRIRFHVDTLIGLPEGSKLPSATAATANDSAHSPQHPSTSTPEAPTDPRFPYKNGPGHKDATPQQLEIMHKMLEDAGLKSFRPNFAKSVSANENRSIWNVCLKIFNKLVECGEYDGVAIGGKHDTFNKKCLNTYARSLSKRYRLQSWDPKRLEQSQTKVRQASRLSTLKKTREKGIFSQPDRLLKLSGIMEEACSDDETDSEVGAEGHQSNTQPCVVRVLEWRSEKLRYVCMLLDAYMARRKASIPKAVRKYSGRPSRPRIRRANAPISKIPAPSGLPVDCYCETWLKRLQSEDPLEYSQLEIEPTPILDNLVRILEGM